MPCHDHGIMMAGQHSVPDGSMTAAKIMGAV